MKILCFLFVWICRIGLSCLCAAGIALFVSFFLVALGICAAVAGVVALYQAALERLEA